MIQFIVGILITVIGAIGATLSWAALVLGKWIVLIYAGFTLFNGSGIMTVLVDSVLLAASILISGLVGLFLSWCTTAVGVIVMGESK